MQKNTRESRDLPFSSCLPKHWQELVLWLQNRFLDDCPNFSESDFPAPMVALQWLELKGYVGERGFGIIDLPCKPAEGVYFRGEGRYDYRDILPTIMDLDCGYDSEIEPASEAAPREDSGTRRESSEILLLATDPEAHLFRDGNQWCDVQYARTIGVSSRHIDRARKPNGVYGVRLTERRKADAIGKPFVYRRSELNELSEAIPDDRRVEP